MRLLDEFTDECIFLNRAKVDDGYGGTKMVWAEGASFKAAIAFDSSIQARTAEKQGVTSLYSVFVSKDLMLDYGDVFKRKSDGKIFRATSDGDDQYTPKSSPLNKRRVSAEEYVLTGDDLNG